MNFNSPKVQHRLNSRIPGHLNASCRHTCTHNTRYASKQNFCKPRPRTNTGKQMFSYQAIDLWHDIPYYLKDLNTFYFAKEIKHYLLSEQYSKKFEQ